MMDLVIDRLIPKLCKAFNITEEDIWGKPEDRSPDGAHLRKATSLIDSIMAQKTWAEWKPIFDKYDIWHAVMNKFENMWDDPQANANGALVQHPDIRHPLVGVPILMSAHTAVPQGRAPKLGEHTSSILKEYGFSPQEEEAFRKGKVVA